MLDRGGVCYATKLPYDNMAKDKFASVTYNVGLSENGGVVDSLSKVDGSLTSYLDIKLYEECESRIDANTFDSYRTGTVAFSPD